MPSLSDLTDYDPMGNVTGVAPDADGIRRVYINSPGVESKPASSGLVERITNKLLGLNGQERYQLWPEKVVREGLSAAGDAMSGKTPQWQVDPVTGDVHTSPQMIEGAQAMSALAGSGGLAGGTEGAALNATPSLRPALKYKDRLYKGKEGQAHQDVIPDALYPEFQQMAMRGEDISHYNFGFVNDKGQFLTREKALEYGVNTGLIDPAAGKYGALTSTLLADSSKPGMAIEATAKSYPLAKPSDRWTNTLGQNDHLMQTMTPDEFLAKGRPLKIDAESRETIDALKQHILEGKQLDPLELKPGGKEDGRHRAIAAKELGIKEVPVLNHRPPENAPQFYSALEHNVGKIAQDKMTGDQWLGTLANKPGVKPEELQWSGLKDMLEANKGKPVSKEQIAKHLEENKTELGETQLGKNLNEGQKEIIASTGARLPLSELDNPIVKRTLEKIGYRIGDAEPNVIPTKYSQYQVPGGDPGSYREVLMTLPQKRSPVKYEVRPSHEKLQSIGPYGVYEVGKPTGQLNHVRLWDTAEKANANAAELNAKNVTRADGSAYKSSHWDEPNILAHMRMNDRTIDGKKSLHLEEVQSDWHQDGRKEGYKSDKEKIKTKIQDLLKEANSLSTESGRYKDIYQELPKLQAQVNGGVPDAPFKKNWHELALKRAIREAAENGYDRLSWTAGEHHPTNPKNLNQRGPEADAADKGMQGFYNSILPKSVEKLTGQKVKEGAIATKSLDELAKSVYGREETFDSLSPALQEKVKAMKTGKVKVYYIDLPQSVKDTALGKGFPLFSSTHMFTPVAGDPFKDQK